MNVKEFYKWAKDNDCEDYEINVECYDEEGDISEVWLDSEKIVKKRRFDVLIKCAEQSFRRENCNMLQKSLAGAVAKNATAQTPLKKLQLGTKSPQKKFRRCRR